MSFLTLMDESPPLPTLAKEADALGPQGLWALVDQLDARRLAHLFALAGGGAGPVALSFFVPPHTPPGHTVEWRGRNSLPLFTRFSKRFTRGDDPSFLTGHNHNGAFRETFVGPGYFCALPRPGYPGEFLFDYTRYPSKAPEGWPKLVDNWGGFRRLAFGGLHDYFRPVGAHFGVGATYSASSGKFRGQYFVLVRGDTFDARAPTTHSQ